MPFNYSYKEMLLFSINNIYYANCRYLILFFSQVIFVKYSPHMYIIDSMFSYIYMQ